MLFPCSRHSSRRAAALLFSLLCLLRAPTSHAETIEYILKKGDTLWQLSSELLGSTARVEQLQRGNRVKRPRLLRPGAVLQLPRNMLVSDEASIIATFVSGDVSLYRDGQPPVPLRTSDRLAAGDRIDTATDAQARLHFFDDSRLQLGENSSLRIARGDSFARGRIRHIEVHLDRGSSEYHIAPQRDPNRRFEIITPAATTSVRGTRFRIRVDGEGRLQEEVLSGETLVHNALGKQPISRGEGIAVTPGQPPSEVITLLPPPDIGGLPDHIDGAELDLGWPGLPGATHYQIQLADNPDFTRPLFEQRSSKPELKHRVTTDAELYLRVAGIDARGFVGLPATHSLRLSWKPATPSLPKAALQAVFPEGASTQWAAVDNASRYRLQVAAGEDFSRPLQQHWLDRTQAVIGESLLPGRYRWRISAQSEGGRLSDSSATAALIIDGPQPAAPEPFELHDLIVLRWPAMLAADRYQLTMQAAGSDAAPIAELQTEKTIGALPLPEAGDYRVRLRVIYANGNPGPWSEAAAVAVRRRPYEVLLLPLLLGM